MFGLSTRIINLVKPPFYVGRDYRLGSRLEVTMVTRLLAVSTEQGKTSVVPLVPPSNISGGRRIGGLTDALKCVGMQGAGRLGVNV